jgi:hypothetical protein
MRTFHYVLRNPKLYDVLLPTILAAQAGTVDDEVSDEVLTHVGALRDALWRDALWRDTQGGAECDF